jgi:transcription elongation factor GreA
MSAGTCYTPAFGMKAQIVKRFEDEIQQLDKELKTELPKEIQRARELGDLRENAEYKAAKERQDYLNARIAMLKRRVAEISLINLDKLPTDRAAFGSVLELLEGTGDKHTFQLVMPEDANAEKGWISTASPIGKALLGKEEGDEVNVPTPTGVRTFEILKLTTIHAVASS